MERLREQLEGAIQVALAGLVIVVAFVASHIQPWNVPEFRGMRTFALLFLAALALVHVLVVGRRPRPAASVLVVVAFAALALLSASWSPQPGLTLERGVAFAALIVTAAALAVGVAGRPRAAGQILLALFAATVAITVAGLVELWHSPDQAILPATKGQGARYNGIGANPNQVAMLIGITLPLALWSIRASAGKTRMAVVAATLLLLGSLIASGSRGAIVGAFLGCAAYLLAVLRRRRVAAAALVTLGFVAAIGATQLPQPADENPPLYGAFGQTPKLSPYDLNSQLPLESELDFPGENAEPGKKRTLFFSSGRTQAWELAIRQALERPVAGYGFGTEDEAFVDRSYMFVSRAVENSYLSVLLQLGVLGVLLVLASIALPLAAWLRVRPTLDDETAEAAAAAAGVVIGGAGVAISQSYVTSVGSPPTAPFWIALFLVAALSVTAEARRRASSPAGRARSASAT